MVKGISSINGYIKTGVVSALLAGSTALYASNPIKKDVQPNKTEVVSKEGAEALKAANIQGIQQTSVPTVSNPKLNTNLRKFAKNQEEKNIIDNILKDSYKENGTFLGSALIQHEIDRQNFFMLIEENTDLLLKINPKLGKEVKDIGPKFYDALRENAKKLDSWIENTYTPNIYNLTHFDRVPTADKVIERIDYIAEEKAKFDLDDMIEYHVYCDNFQRNELKNRTDNQALSDLAAYKMFMLDKLMMKNALYNYDVFLPSKRFSKNVGLLEFYDAWMNTISPKIK